MAYLVLARKYRPQTFEDLVQQRHVSDTLKNAIHANRMAHAILFSGPRGTGKTTIARILAKAMNCGEGPTPVPCNQCRACQEITRGGSADVYEIDGASNNGVDNVRDLRENIKYAPVHDRYKIYIIDEVHMLSTAAFNALLKTLEEPPAHVLFFLATTEPHKIPITILSRCQRHDLRRISVGDIVRHMADICRKEDVRIPEESLAVIARTAGGSMRDALSLLDHVLSCAEGPVSHGQVLDLLGMADRKILFHISEALFSQNMPGILSILHDLYYRGYNLKEFYASLLDHFRNLLMVRMGQAAAALVDAPESEIRQMREQVPGITDLYLTQILDTLIKEEQTVRFSSQPKLAVEMVFLRLFFTRPALPIEALIEKIEMLGAETDDRPLTARAAVYPVSGESVPDTLSDNRVAEIPEAMASSDAPADDPPAPRETCDRDPSEPKEQMWNRLVRRIRERSSVAGACLAKAGLKQVDDTVVHIEVFGGNFHLGRIQKHQELIQSVCEDYFGKKMEIRLSSGESAEPVKPQTAGRVRKDLMNHPLVAEAIAIFNGRLTDVKIS